MSDYVFTYSLLWPLLLIMARPGLHQRLTVMTHVLMRTSSLDQLTANHSNRCQNPVWVITPVDDGGPNAHVSCPNDCGKLHL